MDLTAHGRNAFANGPPNWNAVAWSSRRSTSKFHSMVLPPARHLLLLERKIPDTLGARKILLPYSQILAVKITDVVKMKAFQSLGFDEPAAKRSGVT